MEPHVLSIAPPGVDVVIVGVFSSPEAAADWLNQPQNELNRGYQPRLFKPVVDDPAAHADAWLWSDGDWQEIGRGVIHIDVSGGTQ